MKICYISPCKDGTGYSVAAVNTMMAIEQTGIDVVSRPINLTPPKGYDIYLPIEHLEMGDTKDVDVVIQHILPEFFERKGGVKNIGYFHWETSHFRNSNWTHKCNLMDQIWVASIQQKQAALDSGVTVPIKIVPVCVSCTNYERSIPPLDIPDHERKCIFYTIGEFNRRKNFVSLVRAYYVAFKKYDNVLLIIKTGLPGADSQATMKEIIQLLNGIRDQMRITCNPNLYPSILIKTDFMPTYEIHSLHSTGDIFVTASRGEAGCIPAMDAMRFGNPVIASNWGNLPELLYEQAKSYFDPKTQEFQYPGEIATGWLTPGQLTTCFGMPESNGPKYLGNELWFDVNIPELTNQFREAYSLWLSKQLQIKGDAAIKRITAFGLPKIGELIKSYLGENNG